MRVLQTTLLVYVLSLSDVVVALGDLPGPSTNSALAGPPPPQDPPGGKKGTTSSTPTILAGSKTITFTTSIFSLSLSTTPPSTTTVTTTELPPTISSSSSPSINSGLSTTINTIDISSFMTSALPALSTSTRVASVISNQTETYMSMSSTSTASQPSNSNSISHRSLVVILSTILGLLGLILITVAIFLLVRFRRGLSPFGHRGASPINDDEIESWRRSDREKPPMTPLAHETSNQLYSLPIQSPAWTWAASPTSIRTVSAHESELRSVVTKAPNARAGLTDETIPGADPFITPPKRQSSRLSKAPPGHARSKSRRSSMSTKSIWSGRERSGSDLKGKERQSTWYDQEDDVMSSHTKTDNSSSPRVTEYFDSMPTGGLSPRPKSRPRLYEISRDDIGRAIA